MARRSFRNRFIRFRQKTRVIYQRARSYRPRRKSNKKTLLILAGVAVVGFLFKDKIGAMLAKKS